MEQLCGSCMGEHIQELECRDPRHLPKNFLPDPSSLDPYLHWHFIGCVGKDG